MSNTISSLTAANTIDAVNDYLVIDTASLSTTQKINRNTLLGLGSAPVGLTDSQTLTNKILTSPTINGATLSGTLTGTYTLGGTPTFPSSVVTLTGSQTLTNKILTSPTINSPSITNATITADTLSGYTTSNNGTIYGISVTGGVLSSPSAVLGTNGVAASNLASNAITLGYAQSTANFTTTSATAVQVTNLTVTVTIPAGGRRIKITAFSECMYTSSAAIVKLSIWDGTVGSGTQLSQWQSNQGASTSSAVGGMAIAVVSPAAGSKTYNVGFQTSAGTGTLEGNAAYPAFILVEAI